MSLRTALARPFTFVAKALEGSPRPGPWSLPVTGATWSIGTPSRGQYWNNWHLGGEPWGPGPQMATVEACKSLYTGAIASCPIAHFVKLPNGGRRRVDTSDLSRIFLSPNDYQTWADFIAEVVRCLLDDGNAYAIAVRNNRFEVDELHLMDPRMSFPVVVPETGDIAYAVGGNDVVDNRPDDFDCVRAGRQTLAPGRDVLHFKLPSYRSARRPTFLLGEGPLVAMLGVNEILRRLAALLDEKHPKAVATLDLAASRDQIVELRDRLKEAYVGSIPIMSGGAKLEAWKGPVIGPKDIELLEFMRFSLEEILAAFHVPPALLGLGGAPAGATSELFLLWKQTGLGPLVENLEQRLDKFFRLRGAPYEFSEFDLDSLLRGDEKARIETLARAVQSGIFSPDEARNREDLPRVPGGWGEEPRVQQQVVPLSAAAAIPPTPPAAGPPAAAPVEIRLQRAVEEEEGLKQLVRAETLRRRG